MPGYTINEIMSGIVVFVVVFLIFLIGLSYISQFPIFEDWLNSLIGRDMFEPQYWEEAADSAAMAVSEAVSKVAGGVTRTDFIRDCNAVPGEPCKSGKCPPGSIEEGCSKTFEGLVCCELSYCEELVEE